MIPVFAGLDILKNFLGNKEELKDTATKLGKKAATDLARRTLTAKFQKAAKAVEEQFLKDGWTLTSPPSTEDGKKAAKKRPGKYQAALADLQFRLWDKGVFEPIIGNKGSGTLADAYRDKHETLVYQSLGNQLKDNTPIADVIQLIITREVDITL